MSVVLFSPSLTQLQLTRRPFSDKYKSRIRWIYVASEQREKRLNLPVQYGTAARLTPKTFYQGLDTTAASDGSAYGSIPDNAALRVPGTASTYVLFCWVTGSNSARASKTVANGATQSEFDFVYFPNAGSGVAKILLARAGSAGQPLYRVWGTETGVFPVDSWVVAVATCDDTDISIIPSFWVNGQQLSGVGNYYNGSGSLQTTNTTTDIRLNRRDDETSSNSQSHIALAFALEGILSDEDIRQLSANVWRVFEPEELPYFFTTGGNTSGTGTASFTFTATGTGSSLSNSTGSASFIFTPTGVGASTVASTGSATVAFNATGIGASLANTTGSSSFVFTATGVGASSTSGQGVGSASILFNASAVGQSNAASTGSASFVFNATAVGANASGAGAASFTFTATGVGTSGATSSGVGTASFTFDAVGYSQDFVYPAKVKLYDEHTNTLIIALSNTTSLELADSAVTKLTLSDIGNV